MIIYSYIDSNSKLAIRTESCWKAYDNEDGAKVVKAYIFVMVFSMVSNIDSTENPRKISHLAFSLIIEWE